MRPLWVTLPVKDFARAKSRMAPVLDAAARADAARRMFLHVLSVVSDAGLRALVVTDGDAPAELARALGADVLADPSGAARLGHIVDAGLDVLRQRGITESLVLMADLPQLTRDDLAALVQHDGPLVVAPDEAEAGTNALRLRLDRAHPTAFGHADSFQRHLAWGAAVVRRPGLARDVDLPEHVSFYERLRGSPIPKSLRPSHITGS